MGEDFVPGSGGVASPVEAFWYPPLRKVREATGHPLWWWSERKSKPGPAVYKQADLNQSPFPFKVIQCLQQLHPEDR